MSIRKRLLLVWEGKSLPHSLIQFLACLLSLFPHRLSVSNLTLALSLAISCPFLYPVSHYLHRLFIICRIVTVIPFLAFSLILHSIPSSAFLSHPPHYTYTHH